MPRIEREIAPSTPKPPAAAKVAATPLPPVSWKSTRNSQPTEDPKNEVDIKLDRLNDLWMKLERKLLKRQPPRRITCGYRDLGDEDGEVFERRYVGIQRHHGRWRICYAVTWDQADETNLPWKPITECDIETRVDATKGIDKLKFEVDNTRTVFIPALDKAIDRLEKSLLDAEED